MYRSLILIGWVLSCLTLGLAERGIQLEKAEINSVFAALDRPDSPGCALGITEKQELVFTRGYGQANLEHQIPIAADTVFRIGSTSKQFTAMAILLLAQEGRLSLEDDIRKFLPELPDYGHQVRVRHLIHHTSGLRDYLTLMSLAGLRGADYYTDDQVLAMLARQQELNFPPGEQFLYSNSGYFLLAEIVKRVSGKDLRQFAQEHILAPLGMESSHFQNDHQEIVPRRASGYRRTADGFRISMTTLEMIGDGGLFTTVEDLLRWDSSFYTGKIGGKELIQEMLKTGKLNSGHSIDYASGLRVADYRGLPSVRHGGSFVGFRAELLRFPVQEVSIICLCNLAQTNPSELANRVADVVLQKYFPGPGSPLTGRREADLQPIRSEQISARVGTWETEEGDSWKISRQSGEVWLELPRAKTQLLASVDDPETWRSVGAGPALSIRFEKLGAQAHLGEREVRLTRAELVNPTPSQLTRYSGRYTSQELGIEVEILPLEGGLQVGNLDPFRDSPRDLFLPTTRHRFNAGGTRLHFEESPGRGINSFRLSSGRVRNILFEDGNALVELPAELETWIGQMLLVGFRGTELAEESPFLDQVQELNLGGVILFDYDVPAQSSLRNIESAGQLRELTATLQAAARIPLLIAIDQEGGRIARLKPARGFPETRSQAQLGKLNDEALTRANAALMAKTLADLGINLNLAPVLDLALNPQNPVIAGLERSYGANPEKVTQHARWTIEEFHKKGVLSSLKHFPGHGSSREDSHLGLPDVTADWEEIELEPFRRLIRAGLADSVMTAHLFNRKWDPELPATLSSKVIDGILRQQLGFQGVVISDDMQMGAIVEHFSFERSIELAIGAGVDLLAISNNQVYDPEVPRKAFQIIQELVRSGRVRPERIRASFERIRRLKEQVGKRPLR